MFINSTMAIYIESIPNRNSRPAILLRYAKRNGKRIERKTLANLSKTPAFIVDAIRILLKGGVIVNSLDQAFTVHRSLPHGHVAALVALASQIGLPRILHRTGSRQRDLALAAIIARIISPASKLATARALSPETADSSLGTLLKLDTVHGNEMLDMLDWLRGRQMWIERSLANRHLRGGTLILYDVTSSYVEGMCCALAAFGYNRDRKRGKMQIVYGLLCAADGCPVAVEVFPGNSADPSTVATQISKIRKRFNIHKVALVGDRGMITSARIREDLLPATLDWISALRNADIRKLFKDQKDSQIDTQLYADELQPDQVAEIVSAEFPGERLLVCLNPRLRQERARKREQLLRATETILTEIAATARRHKSNSANRDRTMKRLGREANRRKVEKHFDITVTNSDLLWSRNQQRIHNEAQLDGIYVIRTSLPADAINAHDAVAAYKSLSTVERAFRTIKTTRLEVQPIYVYSEAHVRGHVFLCMLACYLEWHLRRRLKPFLFDDPQPPSRSSPVQQAKVSQAAAQKASSKKTSSGDPAHSMTTLLADLATLCLNEVTLPGLSDDILTTTTKPTPLQSKILAALNVDPNAGVSIRMTG